MVFPTLTSDSAGNSGTTRLNVSGTTRLNNERAMEAIPIYKILVTKLPEVITPEDLREHFGIYGTITEVNIPDPFCKCAFITFSEFRADEDLFTKYHLIKGVAVKIHPNRHMMGVVRKNRTFRLVR